MKTTDKCTFYEGTDRKLSVRLWVSLIIRDLSCPVGVGFKVIYCMNVASQSQNLIHSGNVHP
jgi:hypothetical protein